MNGITYGTNHVSLFRSGPVCINLSQNPVFVRTASLKPNPRLQISNSRKSRVITACLKGENATDNFESIETPSLAQEASIDIKLPRRSLLVKFTCNSCSERTSRLINRLAYEKGTVFLQCGGCQVYHKFVDNLGLVVEHDFREEQGQNTD